MADMGSLTDRLPKLSLSEKTSTNEAGGGQEYVLHISSQQCSQNNSTTKLAAASSDHKIKLYSHEKLSHISTIGSHSQLITGLHFDRKDPNLLFSSSLDGCLRCWDIRERTDKAVKEFEGYNDTHKFSSFDQSNSGLILCAGTEQAEETVHLLFWDVRNAECLGAYSDSHQDDITKVCFHPSNADSLVTGSTDGLLCLFDISQSNEDDALLATYNTESASSVAGFCGPDYCNVYGITHDRCLQIWDTEEYDSISKFDDINENFPSKKRTDYLVGCFQNDSGEDFLVGGSNSGDINVYLLDRDRLVIQRPLSGKHTDVVRCFHWENKSRTLVTGGEDGMLCLWKPELTGQSENGKLKASSSIKKKKKKRADHHQKPY